MGSAWSRAGRSADQVMSACADGSRTCMEHISGQTCTARVIFHSVLAQINGVKNGLYLSAFKPLFFTFLFSPFPFWHHKTANGVMLAICKFNVRQVQLTLNIGLTIFVVMMQSSQAFGRCRRGIPKIPQFERFRLNLIRNFDLGASTKPNRTSRKQAARRTKTMGFESCPY